MGLGELVNNDISSRLHICLVYAVLIFFMMYSRYKAIVSYMYVYTYTYTDSDGAILFKSNSLHITSGE